MLRFILENEKIDVEFMEAVIKKENYHYIKRDNPKKFKAKYR